MDEDGEDSRDVRDDSKGPRKPRDAPVEDPNDTRTPQERINDQVTPLWRKSYEEQLDIKQKRFKNGMGNLKKNLLGFLNARDVATEKREDLKYVKELGETVCPLETVVPSPIIDDYRTKCEFTIGFDLDGQKSVGFLLGLFKDGVTTVLPPTECKNVPGAAKKVASMLQDFVQGSELPVYDRNSKEGFWRLVLVRTHTTGDVMVIVQINPVKQDAAVVTSEIEKLSQGFQASKNVTTLLIQESSGQFNGFQEGARTRVVFGEGVVHEELLGLRFRISPTAFFQVNTPATNGLYGRVREWCTNPAPYPGTEAVTEAAVPVDDASKNKNVVLLDLCCGTGTIGLTMAPNVKRVVGVEMVAEAVQDAQYNARLQGCSNVHYICSKVEDAMKEVFSKHVENGDEVVAVLDPPPCKGIKRVVFISCDFDAAMQNFVDLCRPTSKKFQGRPFRPVRAVPFDLFPHTSHCEFVMELQRKD
ncbi:S-adenosyl-L-methionine-dependent methyltransferase [Chytriomyces sp. MP71]|nr:S-adenosyl-L-methionine-dependent methyltransferase [Chytriomyces sp. MP71]